jgi:selenocysteine lyase/cysteine desulfurase
MSLIDDITRDEALRRAHFPVVERQIYLAHAGTTPLPKVAGDALRLYADETEVGQQETKPQLERVRETRERAAQLIGAHANEIALLGPTAVGLSLVALGLDWQPDDEVVCYFDDYATNVVSWAALKDQGVRPVYVQPEHTGVITWEIVEAALTDKTKLVALASCHFLSGYRIDLDTIGRNLRERGVLFCVDGIQTAGAFPTPVEYVDFLSADSHKWMLGPAAAGILYVRKDVQRQLKPALLGKYNVQTKDFLAQEDQQYFLSGARYEPGILNLPGIMAMHASLGLLLEAGPDAIAARLLELRAYILERLRPMGYRLYLEDLDGDPVMDGAESAILSFSHPDRDLGDVYKRLVAEGVAASHRRNRDGVDFLRLSPHFYNTFEEIDRVASLLSF